MGTRRYDDVHLLGRLFGQARPYWPHLAGLLVLAFLATPVALLLPLPLALVVDSLSGAGPVPELLRGYLPQGVTLSSNGVILFAALLVVGLSLLDQGLKMATSLLSTYVGEKVLLGFRARIFRHVQRLSLIYHDRPV